MTLFLETDLPADIVHYRHALDWLNLTAFYDRDPRKLVPSHLAGCEIEGACRGMYGYSDGYKLKCGGKLFYNPNRHSMGVHFQYDGGAIRNLMDECDHDPVLFARSVYPYQLKKVSRMDIAADIFNGGQVDDLMTATESGGLRSRLKPQSIIKDWQVQNNAKTLYYGSPNSDFRVRCYDKAHEMNVLWMAWTRVEAQARNKQATALYTDIVMQGTMQNAIQTIKARFNFPDIGWYQDLMQGVGEKIAVPHKPDNFPAWLEKQVIPAILKRLDTGEHEAAILKLHRILSERLD